MTSEIDGVLQTLHSARPRVVLTSSAERAAEVVRERITDGAFHPGDRLPEEPIAEALGISRNTLREALGTLVSERVLVRRPNRGVFVRTPTAADVRDIYRARRVIEPGCLRAATSPDGPAAARSLLAAVDAGAAALAAGDGRAVASANQRFHRAVVALGGSARLDAEMSRLLAEMRLVFSCAGSAEDFHGPYVAMNRAIAESVRDDGAAAAAPLLDEYLVAAERHLLSAFTS
ncbi:GntR family transcriptional regulator [Rhodococcus rhodnii]|uniref:GntR family transcriptional regulator n=1 Tax=Rhodococcus rhodnii LMG 5362 TaxID=1273125 RepID=R7WP85_9NOCA|nr:GntR family transcriptional regulator [Rhodococcus rhodnii]EOM77123.1 GntR family transcriptional regulator [Rhodococcus rhodnii LMG 5362]